jgi:hypothetical protein
MRQEPYRRGRHVEEDDDGDGGDDWVVAVPSGKWGLAVNTSKGRE